MSRLNRPWFWLLAVILGWLALVTVLIALGHGGGPGHGGAP